jgi:hypothetical protein
MNVAIPSSRASSQLATNALVIFLSIALMSCIGHPSTSVPPKMILEESSGAPQSFSVALKLATEGMCIQSQLHVLNDRFTPINDRISFAADLLSLTKQTGAKFHPIVEREVILYMHAYAHMFPGRYYVENKSKYELRSRNHVEMLFLLEKREESNYCLNSIDSFYSCITSKPRYFIRDALAGAGKVSTISGAARTTQCVWGKIS